MADSTLLLKTMDLFSSLNVHSLKELSLVMHPMSVKEGEELISMGSVANAFFIVISGHYMVYFKDGKSFTLYKSGDLFGWSTLISSPYYVGTCVALTDGELLHITKDDFFRIIHKNPSISKILSKFSEYASNRM